MCALYEEETRVHQNASIHNDCGLKWCHVLSWLKLYLLAHHCTPLRMVLVYRLVRTIFFFLLLTLSQYSRQNNFLPLAVAYILQHCCSLFLLSEVNLSLIETRRSRKRKLEFVSSFSLYAIDGNCAWANAFWYSEMPPSQCISTLHSFVRSPFALRSTLNIMRTLYLIYQLRMVWNWKNRKGKINDDIGRIENDGCYEVNKKRWWVT